jgi:glucosamine--fructose-6-phosphate aminotransferase (isomerizing)
MARRYGNTKGCLFLGRGPQYPIALEGALKLKEISYIHAEGYAAGEMKHGPIALIDEHLPVVVLVPRGPHYEKAVSNLAEVKARQGKVHRDRQRRRREIGGLADDVPGARSAIELQPILSRCCRCSCCRTTSPTSRAPTSISRATSPSPSRSSSPWPAS